MFNFDASQLDLQISCFLLVLFRISTMMMADVIMGSRLISPRFRIMLALSITVAIFPLIKLPSNFEIFSMLGALMVLQQIVIGLFVAIIFQFIFQITVFGGQLIAYQSGLGVCQVS